VSAPPGAGDARAGLGPGWDLDALLDDRGTEILLCCGSGGVGKTTTAAALALRAAERGRRVAVLTVDPARRLSQALGTAGKDGGGDGAPVRVAGVDTGAGGSLDALVLDVRRTLDQLVDSAVPPERAATIRANPVYESLASSFSGTQEYMAMERLGQLRAAARAGERPWDLLVVDTPPSRSALDFLDAPRRLSSFLDGRFLRVLLAPARLGGRAGLRVVGVVAGGLAAVMDRVLGARLLRDVEALVSALDAVFGGFRARADATYAALADARTAFVVVAAPEPDPLAEAVFFVRRLRSEGLRLAAVVVNRVAVPEVGLPAGEARTAARSLQEEGLTGPAAVLRLHADLAARAGREHELVAGALAEALGGAGGDLPAVAQVAARAGDVADLPALRGVGADLAAG
jgi:anion-transporting  ArsA/GET3 family ATPase